jgi:hypothetical protein
MHKMVERVCMDCGRTRRVQYAKRAPKRCQNCDAKRRVTHGHSNTKLEAVYRAMLQRCGHRGSEHPGRKFYEGMGITVCEEWRSDPSAFFAWAKASGYREGLTLERIDNEKGYSRENCDWATMAQQSRNRRSSVLNVPTVLAIRKARALGHGPAQICRDLGLAPHLVDSVIYGHSWVDVR